MKTRDIRVKDISIKELINSKKINHEHVGKILWWDDRDGFGIVKDAYGNEYYFDSSVVQPKNIKQIKRNAIITFEINSSIKDCLCANQIRVPQAAERKKAESRFVKENTKASAQRN